MSSASAGSGLAAQLGASRSSRLPNVDPEGVGFVASLARPGSNTTGFANFDAEMGGRWLQSLKEVAPDVTRIAVFRNPAAAAGFLRTMQAVSPAIGVEPVVYSVRDAAEIVRAVDAFVGRPNVGLIVLPDPILIAHRGLIIELAAKHHLPAIYPFRIFATDGGLMVYGVDLHDQLRRAASYVDRILKGEKPSDFPVQAPSKFELVMNLKTAKALGITVPPGATRPCRRPYRDVRQPQAGVIQPVKVRLNSLAP